MSNNKPSWTPQQKDAIQDRGGSLLVSAAAGSGKTTVLVERAMQLICDETNPIKADSLVIMTFTNATAAELKSSISAKLKARIEDARLQAKPTNVLAKQQLDVQRAVIGTVDSFCKQLVTENFNLLGIPSDIAIGDNAQLHEISQNVLAKVMEEMSTQLPFSEFCDTYGKSRSDEIAEKTILKMYNYINCFPDKLKKLEGIENCYCKETKIEKSIWSEQILSNALASTKKALNYINLAEQNIVTDDEVAIYGGLIDSEKAPIERILQHLQAGDISAATTVARVVSFERFPSKRKADTPNKEFIKQFRDNAKAIVVKLKDDCLVSTEQEYQTDIQISQPMIADIVKACRMYDELFTQAKIEEKILEFSDFEHLTLKLLVDENGNKTPFAKQLSKRFSVVMVDEYQDTNNLQNCIYEALANDDLSNLFYVGDIKQCVYQFRQANPENFIQKRDVYHSYDGKSYPATIFLPHNFRSHKNIIDSVNDIFESIMTRKLGGVDYDDNEKLRIYQPPKASDTENQAADNAQEKPQPECEIKNCGTELHVIDCSKTGEVSDEMHIAKQIKKMLEDGEPVKTKEGIRKIRPNDIAILLRSAKSQAQGYAKALEACGVAGFVGEEENILKLSEIQPIIAMLRVIDNPCLDVALAAVVLSPMFGFTTDLLASLRASAMNTSLYSAVLNCKDEKAIAFIKTLEQLTGIAGSESPYEVYKKMLELTDYELCVGGMKMGATKREAVKSFTSFIKGYKGTGGLSGFLRYLDNALETGSIGGNGSKTAPEGFVNIMSIHASKGLEFPVCFVAQLQREFNMQDINQSILLDEKLEIGLNLKKSTGSLYRTIPHQAIAMRMRAEQLSEQMRVLYVALTRAKQRLILTYASKTLTTAILKIAQEITFAQGIDRYSLLNCRSYAQWILYAVMTMQNSMPLWQMVDMGFPLIDAKVSEFLTVKTFEADEKIETKQQEKFEFAEKADLQLASEITASFSQAPTQTPQDALPIKVSVSALTHKSFTQNTILKRPSFMYKQGLSAAEKGTVMHSFLQYADFNLAIENLANEKQRLVNGQFISAELIEKLDNDMVNRFLQGDICKQILHAEKVLREYEFITTAQATLFDETQADDTQIYLQGVADCVIINGDKAVVVDYKTDTGKTPEQFIEAYKTQLTLYKQAVEKRLQVKVEKCIIYSLQLAQEIYL